MKILIAGAGVTGLATAHFLLNDGHEVAVVDANAGPGFGASFGNGAQLSYSYVAPLAGPGVLPKVIPWLLRRDAPLRFSPKLDIAQWRWLTEFVLACNASRSNLTTKQLLALSFHSRALLQEYLATPEGQSLDFGYKNNGKLVVYSDAKEFEGAKARLDYQRSLGCEQFALDKAAAQALEPALTDPQSDLVRRMVGAIHTPSEDVGNCYQFCDGFAQKLAARGVKFHYGHTIQNFTIKHPGGPVSGALTDHGYHAADAVVVALGYTSPFLLRRLGIRVPVYPLKGYSLTAAGGAGRPKISITDLKQKVVYAPLDASDGPKIRIAGMADVVGYSAHVDKERMDQLVLEAQSALPNGAEGRYAQGTYQQWAGMRPATPRGTPVLGATPVPGLFLNVGQGSLGWTLAFGSAEVVASAIAGRTPKIPLDGLTLAG